MFTSKDLKQPWYTVQDIASMLHVTVRTLNNWQKDGLIQFEKRRGKRVMSRENFCQYLIDNNLYELPVIVICGPMAAIVEYIKQHKPTLSIRPVSSVSDVVNVTHENVDTLIVLPHTDTLVKTLVKEIPWKGRCEQLWL